MQTKTLALLASLALANGAALAPRANVVKNVIHTFYGYPDNSPAGAATSYSCNSRGFVAGGKGTYDDPRTFASAPGEFNKCEIIWDPYTEKYLVFQDECDQCTSDWRSGQHHIDIWTGSSTVNGGNAQEQCEDKLTPNGNHEVVRDGSTGHTANTGALYSPSTNTCHTENVFPNNN